MSASAIPPNPSPKLPRNRRRLIPSKGDQFKVGVSGNTAGRPKAKNGGPADVLEILNEPVHMTSGGKVTEMSAFEGIFRRLAQKAIEKKNVRACTKFLKYCDEYEVLAPPRSDSDGGVLQAPRGVDFYEWLKEITDESDESQPDQEEDCR